jgi:very-short-patch-repair endonuclease
MGRRIARLAKRQLGVVTRAQLLATGVRRSQIDHWVATGRLHLLHRGVYLVGHAVPPLGAREMAAVLACGSGAVISHRTGIELYELLDRQPGPIHVSIPGRSRRTRDGIRVHRPTTLTNADVGLLDGTIPITSPARTLADFAVTAPFAQLERAVHQAQINKLVTPDDLRARRGSPALRAILADAPVHTRSHNEDNLRALLKRAGFSAFEVNADVHGYECDIVFREDRLVIEADSVAYHSLARNVEADRRKDAHLRAHGFEVLRFTYTQIAYEPEVVVAGIAMALGAQRTLNPLRL